VLFALVYLLLRRLVGWSQAAGGEATSPIEHPPADETAPYRPENVASSRMKTEAEKVALSYRDRLPLVVVRMPGVYGPPVINDEASRISGVSPLLLILSMIKAGG